MPPLSPAVRVTLVMAALFGGFGVALPFLPRWLEAERGLTGLEIGAVLSSAQLARIVVGPMLGAWADGFRDRRAPIRLCALAALCGYAAFFWVEGFWGLLLTGFFAATMAQTLVPLIEAAALRAGQAGGAPYGVIRGLGSAAFIFANVAGGALIARHGLDVAVFWVLASLALTASAAFFGLAADAAPKMPAASSGLRGRLKDGVRLLLAPRFGLILLGSGLVQASHAFYYGFSVLVWRGQGVSADVIGLLWAFGVAVEIGLLFALVRLERRLTPELFLLAGAAAGVVRWAALALAPEGALLWPLQALHALTFAATHVGAMRVLQRDAPEAHAGLAQALYAALASGALMGLATLGSGVLYDLFGAGGYGAMALLSAGGLACLARAAALPRPGAAGRRLSAAVER